MFIGAWILKRNTEYHSKPTRKRVAIYSLVIIALSSVFAVLHGLLVPEYSFWNVSPEFFFVRLGIVCLLLSGCWFVEHTPAGFFRKAISLFGTESLLVYVVHLLIVYGHTFSWSFIRIFGKTLTYPECFGLSVGLIVAMYLLAYIWIRLKQWNKNVATIVLYLIVVGVAIKFVVM